VTIGTLPDDVLLELFKFYLEQSDDANAWQVKRRPEEMWCILVHVCQRWRKVVFASPCRLNLKLVCTSRRPAREILDIWPALPIVVRDRRFDEYPQPGGGHGVDNIIAALGHHDRICEIVLGFHPLSPFHMGSTILMMQESFLALTHLYLSSSNESVTVPNLPDSFLGGSAPRLRSLTLIRIPFPALPNLLLSTNDLVFLDLWIIPHSGYISPKAMVTCLSALTRLERFELYFESPRSRPERPSRRLSSLPRVDLPALTRFEFRGVNEYIEDLVARINAPLLVDIRVSFFNQLLFDISELAQFIDRGAFKVRHATVVFDDDLAWVEFVPTEDIVDRTALRIFISSTQSEWQLSSMAEVCNSFSSHLRLSSLERLDILTLRSIEGWNDDMESIQWLELLQPFAVVKHLYLDEVLALRLSRPLQELTEELSTEVLPALQTISTEEGEEDQLSGAVEEAIRPFIVARQRSSNPVAVQSWQLDWDKYAWS
jgi:hypothetical protein